MKGGKYNPDQADISVDGYAKNLKKWPFMEKKLSFSRVRQKLNFEAESLGERYEWKKIKTRPGQPKPTFAFCRWAQKYICRHRIGTFIHLILRLHKLVATLVKV